MESNFKATVGNSATSCLSGQCGWKQVACIALKPARYKSYRRIFNHGWIFNSVSEEINFGLVYNGKQFQSDSG